MKIKTKKQLKSKWADKFKKLKAVYASAGIKGKRFKETEGYKEFIKREKRALKRWDNRKLDNERKRNYYAAKKQVERLDSMRSERKFSDKMTVFQAFSGRGRIVEDSIINAANGKEFFGSVIITPIEEDQRTRFFSNYGAFRMYVNKVLKSLYSSKDDGYGAFYWSVERSFTVSSEKLILKYEFIEGEA